VILYLTIIGLLISILGLIGLTGFTIERKTKEIGLRKLHGAKFRDILQMISIQFMKWILISLAVAIPISWFLMSKWLNEFPYRIRLHWWLFLTGGVIAMAVAFFTISLQSQRAARTNPADSLKHE